MRSPTSWYIVCTTSKGSDQLTRAFASHLNILRMLRLLIEQHFEFLSLKGGCTGSFESLLVKMPHCWKSHVAAHIFMGGSRKFLRMGPDNVPLFFFSSPELNVSYCDRSLSVERQSVVRNRFFKRHLLLNQMSKF